MSRLCQGVPPNEALEIWVFEHRQRTQPLSALLVRAQEVLGDMPLEEDCGPHEGVSRLLGGLPERHVEERMRSLHRLGATEQEEAFPILIVK